MPRIFLTPLVIAGLLFLPGCSNNKEGFEGNNKNLLDCAVAKSLRKSNQIKADIYMKGAGEEFKLEIEEEIGQGKTAGILGYIELRDRYMLRARKIIADNPKCFTPSQVVNAEFYLINGRDMNSQEAWDTVKNDK